jgi:glycosyltransferase involved in cell wall biosynthesis
MQLKRIAILGRGAHTLPSHRVLLQHLSLRYDITVFCEVPRQEHWLDEAKYYDLKFIPQGNFSRRVRDLLLMLVFIREHFRNRFDLVHAHSTFPAGVIATLAQKFLGVPAVIFLDGGEGVGFPEIQFGDLVSKRRTKINRWVISRAKAVVTLSNFQKDLAIKNLHLKKELQVIPRGVDERMFPFHERPLNVPLTFLSIGYLSPVKDPEMLLRTFAEIRKKTSARLIHVGQDYMDGKIQALAETLGISKDVLFEGYVPYEKIPGYYYKADVLLVTSVFESQAMVAVEAMTAGVLVCGTRVGILADLSDTCCITSSPGDPIGLSNSILTLLSQAEEIKRIREAAAHWAVKHNVMNTAIAVDQLYRSLIK